VIKDNTILNETYHLYHYHMLMKTRGASNKVDIARFPLRYAMLRCDFSFDGYLHLSRLRNYGGRVHISLLLVQILSKNGSIENKE